MNWALFLSTFTLIFLAELPDKTAFATLLMATRGKPIAVFIGAGTAFVFQTLVGVIFGSAIGLFPPKWVHFSAGILFLVFAALALRKDSGKEDEKAMPATPISFTKAAWNSFLVIFIAEWGDLTQLATASLSARYQDPVTIFIAAVLALWSVTASAILAGHHLKNFVSSHLLSRVSSVAFAGVGIYFIWRWWQGV
jgi:putative Ca2+/H+ antiporter (TMEM165/GDT1 family)